MNKVLKNSWALFLGMGCLMMAYGFQGSLLGVRAVQEDFSLTATGFMMSGYFVGYFIGAATIPNIISRVGHIRVFAAFASLASLVILIHSILINPLIWFLLRVLTGISMVCIYTVAESWLNPLDWYKTNLIAQVKLHDILRTNKELKRYVHVSTPEVYGSKNGWLKESYNFSPSTPYAASRAACDLHLITYLNGHNFPVLFTRAANVYGPGQQLYRIIPKCILACISGKKF